MTRRPAGYRKIGNLYRLTMTFETNGGVQFKAGEFAVCVGYWRNGYKLETSDGRMASNVAITWMALVEEHDYTELNPRNKFEHLNITHVYKGKYVRLLKADTYTRYGKQYCTINMRNAVGKMQRQTVQFEKLKEI